MLGPLPHTKFNTTHVLQCYRAPSHALYLIPRHRFCGIYVQKGFDVRTCIKHEHVSYIYRVDARVQGALNVM